VGLTKLYNKFFEEPTSQLFKLHVQLNRQVMQAYEFIDSDDILAKVLELNLELAEKEKRGEPVVEPCVQLTTNTNRCIISFVNLRIIT
jgi:hypothetical protein